MAFQRQGEPVWCKEGGCHRPARLAMPPANMPPGGHVFSFLLPASNHVATTTKRVLKTSREGAMNSIHSPSLQAQKAVCRRCISKTKARMVLARRFWLVPFV